MKKRKFEKLVLNKSTIANISDEAMETMKGGTFYNTQMAISCGCAITVPPMPGCSWLIPCPWPNPPG